ncbi:MAG: PmoA family protein [Acidobacteria bacterium]|nr:PmoA family protein [Acidobacteriota bacterium]MBI3471453.1 PmoA family protein [Candidatus Solibacter usitatus]
MKSSRLLLLAAALPLAAQVKLTQGSDRILIEIDGKPFSALFIGAETMKPYLHPLRSASGKQVTRSYPMEVVEGESKDHPHHRGLWFTHGEVNGYDFWGNEPSQKGDKKGKIVLKKVAELKSGKKSGSLTASFDWLDPQGKPLLAETRTVVFYSDPTLRTIDFDMTLRAVETAKFGDTKEGTFAIRLAAGLEEPEKRSLPKPARTGLMVNAEGKKGEKQVWGKRSPWVDYAGELEGEKLGVAIFDHPRNPKHPTYWHSRSYGLFAANIFGEHDFYGDKAKDGSMTLAAGESMRFRYRVVIHPGDAESAGIGAMYKEWVR